MIKYYLTFLQLLHSIIIAFHINFPIISHIFLSLIFNRYYHRLLCFCSLIIRNELNCFFMLFLTSRILLMRASFGRLVELLSFFSLISLSRIRNLFLSFLCFRIHLFNTRKRSLPNIFFLIDLFPTFFLTYFQSKEK